MLQDLQLFLVVTIAFGAVPSVEPQPILWHVVTVIEDFAFEAVQKQDTAFFRIVWAAIVLASQFGKVVVKLPVDLRRILVVVLRSALAGRRSRRVGFPIHQRTMSGILRKQVEQKCGPCARGSNDEQWPPNGDR